jgi:hypothetical protein
MEFQLKFAAFKLKNDLWRVRVDRVSDDLSQIEEFAIDANLSEHGMVGIFKAGHYLSRNSLIIKLTLSLI